jgi:hypothetical protein
MFTGRRIGRAEATVLFVGFLAYMAILVRGATG